MVDGDWQVSPGGLVAALTPLLEQTSGTWIGWPGVSGSQVEPFTHRGIDLIPVPLDAADLEEYYLGFSNATVWPLFHDAIRTAEFHRTWWRAYQRVNQRFAEAAAAEARPGDLVWVQDYQLQLVPQMIRDLRPDVRIAFYLHIPFPPVEIYARNPWRRQLIEGVLGSDLVGFQTRLASANFLRATQAFTDHHVEDDVVQRNDGRALRVITAPVSIDVGAFRSLAQSRDMKRRIRRLREQLGDPAHVFLGADRLDYTKGIDVRLRAFQTFLEQNPERAADTTFVQVAVPSRDVLDDYEEMRQQIEQMVGHINGSYGGRHLQPVQYIYESLPRDALVAYYGLADVMCVTPLRDGMNLVAKEYVTCHSDDGVLILSEFAGVANELEGALQVNPYDIDGMASTFRAAIEVPKADRRRRMRAMRAQIEQHDMRAWVAANMDAVPASAE